MSEFLAKVKGVKSLPIFPLPLVMLPNELLPLHIFEDRYKTMIADVARDTHMFGVTYFEPDDSFILRPKEGTVGCAAEIREVESLPDGSSNILTLGIIRFRLIRYNDGLKPYFVADVEFFEDEQSDADVVEPLSDEVHSLFGRLAEAAYRLGGGRGIGPEINRTTPEALSFLVTAAIGFSNERKQNLLEMTSTIERLQILKAILVESVDRMEESARIHSVAGKNGHDRKKIDF